MKEAIKLFLELSGILFFVLIIILLIIMFSANGFESTLTCVIK